MFYQTFALSLVLILGSLSFCKCSTFKYAVLIDAGSSGSRVKVYQMSVNEHGKVTGPQDVKPIKAPNGEIEPGLSSFANNPSGIEGYLKKLIDSAKSAVPADAYATTPILLMATAGMRLLTQQQQQSVMAEVRRIFSDKSVSPFKFSDENARIISGMDEAVYAWITVNFLNGAFTKADAKTHGILEIGGASVQVSYHPFHRHFTTTVKLGGTKYRLYAKSYLGYGINEVADRFNEYVGKVTGGDGTFRSPCHHSGYETNFQIDEKEVHLVGAPNFRRCKKIMDSLFFCADKNKPCPFENQPPLKKAFRDFYAISAFYYVLKDIGALKNSPLVTVRAIRRAAKKYCREKYDDINKSKYAKRNCLAAVYIHELMMKGFKANNKFKVNGVKEIGGEQLGWVLGGLVYNMKIV